MALARALVYEPSVLLLDEPFSNLDAKLREQMRVELKLLLSAARRSPSLFVTHDQVEALSLSDRIAVMNAGHVEQVGRRASCTSSRPPPSCATSSARRCCCAARVERRSPAGRGHRGDERRSPGVTLHAAPGGNRARPPGAEVLVAIRPEDIQVRTGDGGERRRQRAAGHRRGAPVRGRPLRVPA